MTLTLKDSTDTLSSGKPGDSPRTNPVCLEVGVTIRSLPNETGGLSKPIREEVKTVIVFGNGAVLRCAEDIPAGTTVILSNSNGLEVICRVVAGRSIPNRKGYVEVQFTESVNDFWSTYQDGGTAVPASSQPVPHELRETPTPSPTATPIRTIPLTAAPSKPAPSALAVAPSSEQVGEPSIAPKSIAPRESKANPLRPGPVLTAPAASSYSHSQSAKQSTIGNWNSSDSGTDSEKLPNPARRESSQANSSASSPGPSRDFMSKGLLAYDKPPSSAGTSNGRLPMIVGVAVLAVAGVGAGVFFMHRSAPPAAVTTSADSDKYTGLEPPAVASVSSHVSPPPESVSLSAMKAQPAAQPVAVEQSQSAPAITAVPAVVAGPVTSDANSPARSSLKPEKNTVPAKPSDPLPAPRPAMTNLMTNLKMSSPSAPAKRAADPGPAAAPVAEISASEAVVGSPSTGLLTSSGRISNPPAPPPSAPAPIVAHKTVTAPKLISSTRLTYPQSARQANIQGTVMVSAFIDDTWKVASASAVCGPLLLREAAVNSVRQWKYSPGLLDGKPAPSEVTVGVEFKLN